MARILIAWELGANLGHLARDLPVAEQLRASGHEVAFAVRDLATAAQLLFPRGFGFVQAPVYEAHDRPVVRPACYAEMLLAEGYDRIDSVLGRVRAWCLLFEFTRPDLLVADHAPTALAAARISGLPSLAFGSGFEIPPQVAPLPSIRPWESVTVQRLTRSEERVCDVLGQVAKALGGKAPANLCELFVGPVLATFPELDHYGAREGGHYVGSPPALSSAPTETWPEGGGHRVFAYLRPSVPGFREVLEVLSGLDGVALSVVPGISLQDARRHASARHRIVPHQVRIGDLLAQAGTVIVYGGAGITVQSLLAGAPLLLLPQTVEQWLGARRVVELGAGRMIDRERSVDTVEAALRALLADEAGHNAARRFAARYGASGLPSAVELTCSAIQRALVGGEHERPL